MNTSYRFLWTFIVIGAALFVGILANIVKGDSIIKSVGSLNSFSALVAKSDHQCVSSILSQESDQIFFVGCGGFF
jgi:hypothetical protein